MPRLKNIALLFSSASCALALLFLTCVAPPAVRPIPLGNEINPELIKRMEVTRAQLKAKLELCDGSVQKIDLLGTKCSSPDFEGDYDSTLFNGLLCETGMEPWACDAVKNAQTLDPNDPDHGRFWRSPRLKKSKNYRNPLKGKRSSFSKDMGKGVLLYLMHTRDAAAGSAWTRYIVKTGKLCPDDEDGACAITIMFYMTYNLVAEKVGFEKLPDSTLRSADGMLAGENNDYYYLRNLQAMVAAGERVKGYQFHLVATHLYIRRRLGHWNNVLQDAANLLRKTLPLNPFYDYIARGKSDNIALTLLQLYPPKLQKVEWLWEKRDEELAKATLSMGWDFVFMFDLLLRK